MRYWDTTDSRRAEVPSGGREKEGLFVGVVLAVEVLDDCGEFARVRGESGGFELLNKSHG